MKLATYKTIDDIKKEIAKNSVAPPSDMKVLQERGKRSTPGVAEGIKFDSLSEYIFYAYMKYVKRKIIDRNLVEFFTYSFNGEEHKFFPDFKIDGKFYEVKGIFTAMDEAKRTYTLNLVEFITGEEIKVMKKELDKAYPNWKQNFRKVNLSSGSWKHNYGQADAK